MANIKAFCGYRYNPKKINNIGDVMAPPYDTVSDEEQENYANASAYNIIRVSKGAKTDSDNETNNVYTRAANHLTKRV